MTTIEAHREAFNMGRVVSQTFGAIGRNATTLIALALGLIGLPRAILGMLQAQFTPLASAKSLAGASSEALVRYGGELARYGLLAFVVALVSIILGALMQAAVIHIVVEDLNGRRARVADSLSAGLGVAVPVILLSILVGLGIGLGFILLVVPGLMLATRWIVAVPACVMERQGVFAAMGRSAQLTSGDRWAIFGLMFAFAVVAWIISAVFGGMLAGALFSSANPLARLTSPPIIIFSALISAATSILAAAGVAAIYCELRAVKEGVAPATLAAVFD